MAVNTILIDFSVDEKSLQDDHENMVFDISKNVELSLSDYVKELRPLNSYKLVGNSPQQGSQVNLYQSDRGALITLRIFNNGLITINIEYFKGEEEEAMLSYEQMKELEQRVGERVRAVRRKFLPPIKRGARLDVYLTSSAKQIERDLIAKIGVKRSQAFVPIKRCTFDRFFPSSDERLLEYDIDAVIFEERTAFQKVQIVHSKSLGNMLVLDDLQNISESDLIYTETLMARGVENYKDKEIVILGGGDGALLYELLKEQPKNVIMLEIDDIVMKACAKHMRSICGDVLDNYKSTNYEIIVGDCMPSLDRFIAEGRKFDYVFGDLTDIPISTKEEVPNSKIWDFILTILELSFKILKKDGKFMTHGNGTSCNESLMLYEEQLKKLDPPVIINKSTAFVPSFLEEWVFYQINFASN